jgi:molecular chaperone GrpE
MTKGKKNMKQDQEQEQKQQQVNTEETQEQKKEQYSDKEASGNHQQENEQNVEEEVQSEEPTKSKDNKHKEQEKEEAAEKKGKSQKKEKKKRSEEKEQAEESKKKEEEKPQEKTDKEKLAELQDKYMRLSAEYDNYRKRTLKEKMELTKSAGEDILKGLLPIMDDFERALESIDDNGENESIKEGVHLIYNKFKEFFKQQGIEEIPAQDEEFDTDKHEAISKIAAPNEEMKGKVVDVVQKGYYLNDKVLRFAKVVVGE